MKKLLMLIVTIFIIGIGSVCNADILDLTIEEGTLTPKFDKEILDYTCTIKHDIEQVNIVPEVDGNETKIDIIGNNNLQNGENIVVVKTLENGKAKNYVIKVIKEVDEVNIREELMSSIEKSKKINAFLMFCTLIYLTVIVVVVILYRRERALLKSTVENKVTIKDNEE